jgi:predicted DNA-binding ribbon-helix-helix protein
MLEKSKFLTRNIAINGANTTIQLEPITWEVIDWCADKNRISWSDWCRKAIDKSEYDETWSRTMIIRVAAQTEMLEEIKNMEKPARIKVKSIAVIKDLLKELEED